MGVNTAGESGTRLVRPRRRHNAPLSASELRDCQELLGYRFVDTELLVSALTHASSADRRVVSNERLEFLGDAVLGLVVCEELYRLYPDLLEGELTKIKSVVVSRRSCGRISRTLGMEKYLILGKGMASQRQIPNSVMADVFESLIAAIYLDGGINPARTFILDHANTIIQNAASSTDGGNYKSQLQQTAQRERGETPTYLTLKEEGPDHSKSFKVSAMVGEITYPAAWGRNKKEAEQRAALNALATMSNEDIPYPADDELS